MEVLNTGSLLPVIQLAITPVILISGMGGLMLSMTGRMGRIVDRSRILAGQVHQATGDERRHLDSQLVIMYRRAHLIRWAVTFNGLSMLVSCLLVLAIFVEAMIGHSLVVLMIGLFATSMSLLIAALTTFLRDVFVSLHALQLEVERARKS